MLHRHPLRSPHRIAIQLFCLAACLCVVSPLLAQANPADTPVSIPAGALPSPPQTEPSTPEPAPTYPQISASQSREANDAYVAGTKQVEHKDLAGAFISFQRAAQLNPGNRDYSLALIITRESRASELVRLAATALQSGDSAKSETFLEAARKIDPDNQIVTQHFGTTTKPAPEQAPLPASFIASTLGSPIALEPKPGVHGFHTNRDVRGLLQDIYTAYGITVTFDSSVPSGSSLELNIDDVNFEEATRIALQMTHTFAVPVQPNQVLLVKDVPENRQEFQPLAEETIYLPGYTQEQMTDLANVARNVFDLKQVTTSATGGFMLLRGDVESLKLVNAIYADMLDGGTDVLFEVNLYEVNTTKTRNIGATLPNSYQAFDVLSSAQNLINSNQSLINQALSSGLLPIPAGSSAGTTELYELAFLIGAGVSGASQFTNLLGVFGTYNKLPLIGLSLVTGTTFNLSLNSTDSRLLDAVQIRAGSGQLASFRAGSRYPVITGKYSSGISSSLASQLSGLNVNGTSVSSLLSGLLGSTQANVPQFQFEDLGITLKMTPTVQRGNDISLKLDMKIEALGGTSINDVPVLNNRTLTSTITIPAGQTAMLAQLVSRNELSSIDGLPGLNDVPGFQGTDKSKEADTDEFLITITPHIVRSGQMRISSKRLAAVHTQPSQ